MRMQKYIIIFVSILFMASCATQKKATDRNDVSSSVSTEHVAIQKLNYVRKVTDNATYSQNIVSKIGLTIGAMGKKTSVEGKLQMRKNQVVRITLSPLGIMEVGRLEFTPDYVLVVDRINKEYVKASYNDLDFLRDNGLDFYSLQALFWNQLFLPNTDRLTDSVLRNFDVDLNATANRKVMMKSKDLQFTWITTPESGRIDAAQVEFGKGTAHSSTASWEYSGFTPLGKKQFPMNQVLSFSSSALKNGAKLSMTIKMKKITSDNDWETKTTLSGKYKEVNAEDILGKLMSM